MHFYFDIHCHMLCGVDDGAKSAHEMCAMLDMAYKDGMRAICLTPHYSPYLFGNTFEASERSFAQLCRYAREKYPDLYLYIGHELGYYGGCLEALVSGECRTLAGSRYVLVDFPENAGFFEIDNAMNQLMQAGYIPILAHTERYRELFGKLDWIESFVMQGGKIQLNAASATGVIGAGAKRQWRAIVKNGLAHLIATDGHNMTSRLPKIPPACIRYLERHCDAEYIRDLLWNNACRIINDESF